MNSQIAITLLKDLEQSLDDYCELNDEGKTAFSMAITALELFGISEQLPSVQPELSNNSKELENKNGELISRQDAIAEFNCCELTPDGGIDANYAIDFLEQLPSVQPETNCSEIPNNSDLISRQAAIDVLGVFTQADALGHTPKQIVEALPSAQPEIVRCKDCKYNPKDTWFGCPMAHCSETQRPETAWCWKGEKREDG